MKTLITVAPMVYRNKNQAYFMLALIALILLWKLLPSWLMRLDNQVALLDGGVWQLLLFAVLSFLCMLVTAVVIFNNTLKWFSLPAVGTMVLQIKNLQLWQQFALYWALFALLFLGSLLSLVAVF